MERKKESARDEHRRCTAASADPRSAGRREALKRLGRSFGALAVGSLVMSRTACAPIIDPNTITEIPIDDLPEGRKIIFHADRRVELSRSGDTVAARLMVCTHEFCDLTWHEAENNYRCACHDGKFFPDGRPKSGPVGTAMFVIPARIAGDIVIVGPAGELQLAR